MAGSGVQLVLLYSQVSCNCCPWGPWPPTSSTEPVAGSDTATAPLRAEGPAMCCCTHVLPSQIHVSASNVSVLPLVVVVDVVVDVVGAEELEVEVDEEAELLEVAVPALEPPAVPEPAAVGDLVVGLVVADVVVFDVVVFDVVVADVVVVDVVVADVVVVALLAAADVSPPKRTRPPPRFDAASAAPARAGGDDGGLSSYHEEPFHAQVSPSGPLAPSPPNRMSWCRIGLYAREASERAGGILPMGCRSVQEVPL